jgi:hypothetical protein
MAGVRFLEGAKNCPLLHIVHKDSVVHPAFYTMGTGVFLLGNKTAGA